MKADYKGFGEHLEEYNREGLPTDFKTLIRLAKQYNCPVPKLINGELIYED